MGIDRYEKIEATNSTQRYLQQIKILDTKIEQKEDQYKEAYNAALSVGAIKCDKNLVQTSKANDGNENLVLKYLDLENEIKRKKLEFHKAKDKIINEIQGIPDDRYVNVLYKRYVEYKSYENISYEMHYSMQYVKQLHKQALRAFEKKHLTFSYPRVW